MKQQNVGLTVNLRQGLYLGSGCWLLDGMWAKPSKFCESSGLSAEASSIIQASFCHYKGGSHSKYHWLEHEAPQILASWVKFGLNSQQTLKIHIRLTGNSNSQVRLSWYLHLSQKGLCKVKVVFLKKLKTCAQHPSHLETTVRCHNLQTLGSHYSLSSGYMCHHWCLTIAGQ